LLAHWNFNEFLPGFGTKERETLEQKKKTSNCSYVVVVVVVDMMLELRI
jgi:hypothetical protein